MSNPPDAEEAPWWSRADRLDKVAEVALLQSEASTFGEAGPPSRHHEAGGSKEIVLAEHEVGCKVVCRPGAQEGGRLRAEFHEQIAELLALDGVIENLRHNAGA